MIPDFFDRTSNVAVKNLGPRFHEELNFRLPLSHRFNDLGKDILFRQRITKAVDRYLTAPNYGTRDHTELAEVEEIYRALTAEIKAWLEAIEWSAEAKINVEILYQKISEFDAVEDLKSNELHELRIKAIREDKGKSKSYSYKILLSTVLKQMPLLFGKIA